MSGAGEVIFGFILIIIFLATLSIEVIPIIWIGALLWGIYSIFHGLYRIARRKG